MGGPDSERDNVVVLSDVVMQKQAVVFRKLEVTRTYLVTEIPSEPCLQPGSTGKVSSCCNTVLQSRKS